MESIKSVSAPNTNLTASSPRLSPEMQFLVKQIDDTLTKAKEAELALELKIDLELGAIKGFLISMDASNSEALTKSTEEVHVLQQNLAGLKFAINDLLTLKQELEQLIKKYKSGDVSVLKKEISEIEDQIKSELNKINKLLEALQLDSDV